MSASTVMRLDTFLEGRHTTLLSRNLDHDMVGMLLLDYRARATASITRLFVADGHRMRGHGKLLINTACVIAKDAHCWTIALNVDAENRKAYAFYQRLGFHFMLEYQDGTWLLVKQLNPVPVEAWR